MNNELYEEFSKYGKKYVVNNFSLPTSLSSYISLYNETCGKKKSEVLISLRFMFLFLLWH